MKLRFSLLLIDDNPDSIAQALGALGDHLDDNGFELVTEAPSDVSASAVQTLSRNRGREFDLVAVDYMLGSDSYNGSDVASTIRRELEFTDMVFYSSDTTLNLHEQLAKAEVEGVFVATRGELGEALIGLADTVIGKAVDLNHMRGIAMAEAAEMDLILEDTLADAFCAAGPSLDDVARRTADRVKAFMTDSIERIDKVLGERGIVGLVRSARLFSSAHKYRTLRRVCKMMSPQPDLGALDAYESEVLGNRNMLAHAKEITNNGISALQSVARDGSTTTIDDAWMTGFRRTLREQRFALEAVCAEVKRYFR